MKNIKKFNEFNVVISENLMFHIDKNISVIENIFRPNSHKYYEVLKEGRDLYESSGFLICESDSDLFEDTDIGKFDTYGGNIVPLDLPMLIASDINEAKYKNKEVELNKPMRSSGPKKYKVYVKNPKTGKVICVNFGDVKGGLTSKVNDPKARKAFATRHDCSNKKDKTKPGYWACRLPRYKNLVTTTFNGYW